MSDLRRIASQQARDELFAHQIYSAMADRLSEDQGRAKLRELADQERAHVDFWTRAGGLEERTIRSPRVRRWLLLTASRLLGPAFTVRWLERQEDKAIATYQQLLSDPSISPEHRAGIEQMLAEEQEHEGFLEQGITDERRLYIGAAVLGLNDALVELTGGLTGLVSSISDPRVIGFAGLVVGIAAAFSMAASNFLSVDFGETSELEPRKAAAYTGVAYILVVLALVAPFFVVDSRPVALAITWAVAVVIIAAFSFYSAVMQDASFTRRFTLMLTLGAGVAVVTFFIGRAIGSALGIDL